MFLFDMFRLSAGAAFSFFATLLLMIFKPFSSKLCGRDRGKVYVPGSQINIGKYTGVGFYFTAVFITASLVFACRNWTCFFLLLFTAASSLFGWLDDISEKPWGEYIKGALDALVAIGFAFAFVLFDNGIGYDNMFVATLDNVDLSMNPTVYVILAFILIIVSINATNATDGVDGLSGTLSILAVITLTIASYIHGTLTFNGFLLGLFMCLVLIPYLFFNFNPSKVLMGDAGSRSIGFFIAAYAMYLRIPFSYLIVGLPFLLDGGISIFKITVGRLTKRRIIPFRKLTTPLHDHLKRNKGFSVKKTWAVLCACSLVLNIAYISVLLFLKLVLFIF